MPSIDFAALRERTPIGRVLELLEFHTVSRTGDQLRGACPVHRSTTKRARSFSVNTAKNTFQCFKCGANGNQLDLWAQVQEMNIYDAAVELCQRLGIEPPRLNQRSHGGG